jgi:hypothetical protein
LLSFLQGKKDKVRTDTSNNKFHLTNLQAIDVVNKPVIGDLNDFIQKVLMKAKYLWKKFKLP